MAANLRDRISAARCLSCAPAVLGLATGASAPRVGRPRRQIASVLPECAADEEERLRGGYAELARRVVGASFLDSANAGTMKPFADEGIRRQLLLAMTQVAPNFEAEAERLRAQRHETVLQAKLTELGAKVRNTKADDTVIVDRKLITGASPLASNALGKRAVEVLLATLD